jgi:uncharacterized damage-inducible protein DinB
VLREGFRHHAWATRKLLDHCAASSPELLTRPVPGVYGTLLATAEHLVDSDAWYLFGITGGELGANTDQVFTLDEIVALADRNAREWETLLARDLDMDADITVVHDDGSATAATIGVRLAQALHHGSDHRSQICTALTVLDAPPEEYDVWAWAETVGLSHDAPPTV